jgi:hypothetical protein
MILEPADDATTKAHDEWLKRGDAGTHFDVCRDCADEVAGLCLEDIPEHVGEAGVECRKELKPVEEPQGCYILTGDTEHPSYSDGIPPDIPADAYRCAVCGKALTDEDN